jgi:hypothetical protein
MPSRNDKGFSATSQDVSIPPDVLRQLRNPNFLEELLSSKDIPPPVVRAEPGSFIAALDKQEQELESRCEAGASQAGGKNIFGTFAFRSTLSALADAFYELPSCTSESNMHRLLHPAWNEDPETTLKLIYHFRSIPDGQGRREGFYFAFGWLFRFHPRTAINSLPQLVQRVCTRPPVETPDGGESIKERPALSHGYYKDLLNILCLILTGDICCSPYLRHDLKLSYLHSTPPRQARQGGKPGNKKKRWWGSRTKKTIQKTAVWGLSTKRRQRRNGAHAKLVDFLLNDNKFRALYIAVARIFAESLKEDLEVLRKIETSKLSSEERADLSRRITHAPKYYPSDGASHDLLTNMATTISVLRFCERAYPYDTCPGFVSRFADCVDDPSVGIPAEVAHTLRSFTRRHMISPLRREMNLVECLASAGRWDEIDYSRAPSLCMSTMYKQFVAHDKPRFLRYLKGESEEGDNNKLSFSGASEAPHVLVARAFDIKNKRAQKTLSPFEPTQELLTERQWQALVDRMRESGELGNSIAVCDISQSMGSPTDVSFLHSPDRSVLAPPIFVALAMSLLVARLASPPLRTGSSRPPKGLNLSNLTHR